MRQKIETRIDPIAPTTPHQTQKVFESGEKHQNEHWFLEKTFSVQVKL